MAEDQAKQQQPEAEVQPVQDNSVIRQLREQIKNLSHELNEKKKAEEDKTKTLEEKLAEMKMELEKAQKEKEGTTKMYEAEKALLQNKVNPEFLDLMLVKATEGEDVETLKTKYPSAFVIEEISQRPKPIGKVGLSQTTPPAPIMSKEEVEAIITDPTKAITKEVSQLAKDYGLF